MKTCSVDGCNKKHYAKGYCRNHYVKYITNKDEKHLNYFCCAPDCTIKVTEPNSYCCTHKRKLSRGWGFDDGRVLSKLGENNPNWNGGTSQYKNHGHLKRLRKIKLESVNYVCEKCGAKATEVHHLDCKKNNHNLKNLVAVCRKCHINHYHLNNWGRKRKYGETSLAEMSDKCGISVSSIIKYFKGEHLSDQTLFKITNGLMRKAIASPSKKEAHDA